MITHGIVTYNAGDAVRLLTFGVRANGNLRVRHALLNRLERTGKIHRQQHDIETVNTENIRALIPVTFQITRQGVAKRSGNEASTTHGLSNR